MTIDTEAARRFADDWVAAWNAHDLDAILSHYARDVEFTSPFVAKLLGGGSTVTVRGKGALGDYFRRGLAAHPDLRFELRQVLLGAESATLFYRSANNLTAAEVMYLDATGRVTRVAAHYAG